MESQHPAVERLLEQVRSRVELKDELRVSLRGIAATLLIFAAVLWLLLAVLGGAVLFAVLVQALAG